MKYLITGGTGFIGSYLVKNLIEKKHEIIVVTRNSGLSHDNITYIQDYSELNPKDTIDVVINLAGAPISKKWTKEYKKILINSRVKTSDQLIKFLSKMNHRPQILISASAVGYYGCHGDEQLAEDADPKNEFTYRLCHVWEQKALEAKKLGIKVCIARLGVVLAGDTDKGALSKMLTPFKLCLGGVIGSGRQYFSWIHIDDVIRAFDLMVDKSQSGVYNLTAPNAVTNKEFTKALARALGRPAIVPMPGFMISLLFGEMGEALLLHGQNVIPKHLQHLGFEFKYPLIDAALAQLEL